MDQRADSPVPSDLRAALLGAGFEGRLLPDCPLAPYTSWRIGGPAELLALPAHREDVIRAVRWAVEARVAWKILGNGSNLLVRDEGVRGLVLRVRRVLEDLRREGDRVVAGAGVAFSALARWAASSGLSGVEFGAGIPGTLGGAVIMNAGWHEHEIGNRIEWVDFLTAAGSIRRFDRGACGFGYRTSAFRRGEHGRGVLLEASLKLDAGDATEIQDRLDLFAASRKANQPTELPSCGSVFLKPEGDFAGRLIDAAGLKGRRVGEIEVSPKHANFFVNLGAGTAADVLALVERVEREVEARFGVKLVREFELW